MKERYKGIIKSGVLRLGYMHYLGGRVDASSKSVNNTWTTARHAVQMVLADSFFSMYYKHIKSNMISSSVKIMNKGDYLGGTICWNILKNKNGCFFSNPDIPCRNGSDDAQAQGSF